jgi:DNA primase
MNFDIIRFLEEYSIQHRIRGQKTTRGWVQLQICPFCAGDNYYLGINTSKLFFHCWLCHKSGEMVFLVRNLLGVDYRQAKEIVEKYGGISLSEEEPIKPAEQVVIPGMTGLQPIHLNYLRSRNFDPAFLERRYRINACYTGGRFPYRIVIPIYDNGRLVNATSRDVTGQQQERYMSLRNEEAVVPRNECVYNIDSVVGENVLIVEGPFDVWRIGGATVSLLGTDSSMAQTMRIVAKLPKNLYIIFDSEEQAQKHASELAFCFAPFVKHVEIVTIPVKDPASLSPEQGLEIRNELNL